MGTGTCFRLRALEHGHFIDSDTSYMYTDDVEALADRCSFLCITFYFSHRLGSDVSSVNLQFVSFRKPFMNRLRSEARRHVRFKDVRTGRMGYVTYALCPFAMLTQFSHLTLQLVVTGTFVVHVL